MWRLKLKGDSERGGVAVLVAIVMTVLLGFAALAVDVGMLYSEKAQLRNGADAAALLIAQKCAKDPTDVECSTTSTQASSITSSNALDSLSNVESIILDTANRKVTVTAGAQEAGKAPNTVSLFFAKALGIATSEVNASSSVIWGSPAAGTTPFPLAFSVCQVSGMVDGSAQLLQNHSANNNPDCPLGPSGQTVPGGFAWIVQDPGVCGGSVDIEVNESGSDTGNDGPSNCDTILNGWASELNAGRDVTVLLPVYYAVTGTGSGASYDLMAFAAFSVKGWKFRGGSSLPLTFRNRTDFAGSLACTGDCRGIIGKFIKYVSLSDGYRLGPVDPYGATIVRMSS